MVVEFEALDPLAHPMGRVGRGDNAPHIPCGLSELLHLMFDPL